jgi:molybdopterin-containing oxidoreductase family membrane subunit
VTAFLYSGLGGRPFWNSALLAPRFLTSAFVAGPSFIIVTLFILKRIVGLKISSEVIRTLVKIVRITILINLLMIASEVFTEFYTGGSHVATAKYMYFGLHGKTALVPWAWSALALNIVAAALFLHPASLRNATWVCVACVCGFMGIWIEKGMGLIVPGFIPSTLHEVVEYVPSLTEWKVSLGIWAFGFMVLTIALKIAIPILTGQEHIYHPANSPREHSQGVGA